MGDLSEKQYTFEEIETIAKYLKNKIKIVPKVGIICGSGLGSLGDAVTNATKFEYKDIPNFPVSTVMGHAGRLLFGHIGTTPVVCMQGRFHFYEGYSLSVCTMPVRMMKLLGVTILVVSNAAGGINPSYRTGQIMLIKDQINFLGLAGLNPLRGPNDERFGDRFVAMNDVFDPEINKLANSVGEMTGLKEIQEGVYASVGGPTYETVAEVNLMRVLGVDAVGMSTVHETVVAKHCGLKVFAFSLITNECVASYSSKETPDGEEVLQVAKENEGKLKGFVEKMIPHLAKSEP
jgi:purine-nucleoside phosphorylase